MMQWIETETLKPFEANKRKLDDLDKIAAMFEAAAAEIRSVRAIEGEVSDDARRVLLEEARKNCAEIIKAVHVAQKGPEWEAVTEALENLYAARREKVDKPYHLDVLMEAFEAWLG